MAELASEYFKKLAAQMPEIQKYIGQKIINQETVKFIEKNFRDKGFNGSNGVEKWEQRKDPQTKVRSMLLQSGNLRRHALRPQVLPNGVSFVFPLVYEEVQNEGRIIPITDQMRKFFWAMWYKTQKPFWKNMAVTKNTEITIPKRQFIGESEYLNKRIKIRVDRYMQLTMSNLRGNSSGGGLTAGYGRQRSV